MISRALIVAAFAFGSVALASASEPAKAITCDVVVLTPYIVDGSYTKVVLKIRFRHHMIWSGVQSLTFTSVPTAWARAGVRVGDRLVRIDGQLVDGLKVGDFGRVLKTTVGEPFAAFEVQSSESGAVRKIEVHVKKGEAGEFTITS